VFDHIAGQCSTYSKRALIDLPQYPKCIQYGKGAAVWDTAGKSYIDWNSGLGAISLGYQFPAVDSAIQGQLANGIAFSHPHWLEEETAALLCEMTGTEQVRWCKNGSDAIEAAVRLARKVTGKEFLLTTGYHGSHTDVVTATEGKSGGVLTDVQIRCVPARDPDLVFWGLRQNNVAAVLAEPIFADGTIWPWEEIAAACRTAGALLIFDEVITGFRYGPGPALRHTALIDPMLPDLYCFGKAISNGMPIACVAGPRSLMREFEQNVFFSSTAAAECLSLAACRATLTVMRDQPVHRHLWKIGQYLIDACYELRLYTSGLAPRTQFQFFSENDRDVFLSAMARRGHLLGRDQFINFSHTEQQLESFCTAAEEVLRDGLS
jgi:glutamate-1-semialdehyde 2,1-aminomutase